MLITEKLYSIKDYGAIADGKTLCTKAVQKAVDECSANGGGTMSYYAACYDERIKLSVQSCSFAPYKESILSIAHCPCNYIPSAYKWFEMQDLACLIAPRNLIVVTGTQDDIFPIESVRRGFETVKKIFKDSGVEENCALIETPKGHWWCQDKVFIN